VQEPLARVRAALDEATGAAADPATRALARAVALLADVVESVASPLPAEEEVARGGANGVERRARPLHRSGRWG
jgi:hypothetical protein